MKNNLKIFTAGMITIIGFAPFLAFAEDTQTPMLISEPVKKIENTGICNRLSNLNKKTVDQISKIETKKSESENKRVANLTKKQSDTDAKRATSRASMDGKRVKNWDKMTNNAQTDAEKVAVDAYKKAIQSAVDARKAAVDGAVSIYRAGLKTAMDSNKGILDQALATFKTASDTAIKQAEADCALKIANKTISKTFNKAISDARKIFNDARKSLSTNPDIKTLKKTRDDAIKLAETTFKTATEKAKADLILVLKK